MNPEFVILGPSIDPNSIPNETPVDPEVLQHIVDAESSDKSYSCKPGIEKNNLTRNSGPDESSQRLDKSSWINSISSFLGQKSNSQNNGKNTTPNNTILLDEGKWSEAIKEIDAELVLTQCEDKKELAMNGKMELDPSTIKQVGFYSNQKLYFLSKATDNIDGGLVLNSVNFKLDNNCFRLSEGSKQNTYELRILKGKIGKADYADRQEVELPVNKGIRSIIPFKPYEWNYLIVIFEDNSILKQKININEIKPNQIELDQRVKVKFDSHKINIGQYCVLNNRYLFGALSLKVESSGLTSSHEGSKSSISNLILNKSTSGDQSTTVASYVSNNNPYANITTSDAIASPSPTRKDKLPEKEKEFSAFILIDASSENWSDPSTIKYFEKEEGFNVFGLNRIHYFTCRDRGVIFFEYSNKIVPYVLFVDDKDPGKTKILRGKDVIFEKDQCSDEVIVKSITKSDEYELEGHLIAKFNLILSVEGKVKTKPLELDLDNKEYFST